MHFQSLWEMRSEVPCNSLEMRLIFPTILRAAARIIGEYIGIFSSNRAAQLRQLGVNVTSKRTPTTKDIGLLWQLQKAGQLTLRPEFQRNNVWPKRAKAYLIDSILNDRPIPLFFMQRSTSAQSGNPQYAVIDGQQRLRAIFEYLEDDLPLSEVGVKSVVAGYKGKVFSKLPHSLQQSILNYDLVVQEIFGYDDADIRDMFVRMNRYVVRLSQQELRHAQANGKFKDFVEKLAVWPVWEQSRIFTRKQIDRMRAAEFAAELAILLIEGPQHRKQAVDMYYVQYLTSFTEGLAVETSLKAYLEWIRKAIPDFKHSRFRRSAELYSLIGALEKVSKGSKNLASMDPKMLGKKLLEFETRTKAALRGEAARYVVASSKHTDDIGTRNTRIEILTAVLT